MRAMLLALPLALAACSPANVNDSEYWTPSSANVVADDDAETADDTSTPPPPRDDSGTPPPPSTNCLRVEFTTVSVSGRYSPSHVAAVWITNSSGGFVKTLREWGVRRSQYLSTWRKSSSGNTVDAITAATLKSHGALAMDWNCTDVSKARVAPGKYTVHAEFTESNGQGPVFAADFDVGAAPNSTNPADTNGYKAKLIRFTP